MKLSKIETNGCNALAAYRENRQIVNLQTSKIEAKRKVAMIFTRITQTLGVHQQEMKEK